MINLLLLISCVFYFIGALILFSAQILRLKLLGVHWALDDCLTLEYERIRDLEELKKGGAT